MARSPTTLDAFAAIGEPQRRRILEMIGTRQMSVTQIVIAIGLPQPTVSKHLGVLRSVGLVRAERKSRQMIYELEPGGIRTIHDWATIFEKLWSQQLDRIKARAEAKQRRVASSNTLSQRKEHSP